MLDSYFGEVARAVVEPSRDIEALRGRNSPFEARKAGRQVNGLFESLLAEVFS